MFLIKPGSKVCFRPSHQTRGDSVDEIITRFRFVNIIARPLWDGLLLYTENIFAHYFHVFYTVFVC